MLILLEPHTIRPLATPLAPQAEKEQHEQCSKDTIIASIGRCIGTLQHHKVHIYIYNTL